jgi:hypothetical protein
VRSHSADREPAGTSALAEAGGRRQRDGLTGLAQEVWECPP